MFAEYTDSERGAEMEPLSCILSIVIGIYLGMRVI